MEPVNKASGPRTNRKCQHRRLLVRTGAPVLTHKSHVMSGLSSVFPGHPCVLKRRQNQGDSILHFLAVEFLDGLANFNTVLIGEDLIMLTDHYFMMTGRG